MTTCSIVQLLKHLISTKREIFSELTQRKDIAKENYEEETREFDMLERKMNREKEKETCCFTILLWGMILTIFLRAFNFFW